jgi:uncharacterized DUF497 family protein
VAFEWHPNKADANFRKHGVLFSTEAQGVFDDEFAVIDESDSEEQRFVTLGMGTKARLLAVVYTYRGEEHPHRFGPPSQLTRARRIRG